MIFTFNLISSYNLQLSFFQQVTGFNCRQTPRIFYLYLYTLSISISVIPHCLSKILTIISPTILYICFFFRSHILCAATCTGGRLPGHSTTHHTFPRSGWNTLGHLNQNINSDRPYSFIGTFMYDISMHTNTFNVVFMHNYISSHNHFISWVFNSPSYNTNFITKKYFSFLLRHFDFYLQSHFLL